jgi:7-keto-8-aminopelargonate synthetase-like enzyme
MPLQNGPPGASAKIDGRECLYFAGTGYLGLQGHPEVIGAACDAARQYGIGSANSRTAFGTTPPLLEVERRAAEMFGLDDAFYYASGWMGNNILMQCLQSPGPESGLVLIDEHAHYSIIEAARLSGWPQATFHHCDPDDVQAILKDRHKSGEAVMLLSDGVFAATGRIAPAAEYYDVLRDCPESVLCLDDAHGVAVLGENGRGTFEHAGLWRHGVNTVGGPGPGPYLTLSATLSKAVGGYGGIIPGDREFIRRIKLRSPYFGGASPPPAPIAAATAKALELIRAEPNLRTRLRANAKLLKDGLRAMGFDVDDTPVPIVCLVAGSADNMQRIQRELFDRGIAVAYMAAYAGLGPEGGLRIAVFATHTAAMIRRLLDELRRLV